MIHYNESTIRESAAVRGGDWGRDTTGTWCTPKKDKRVITYPVQTTVGEVFHLPTNVLGARTFPNVCLLHTKEIKSPARYNAPRFRIYVGSISNKWMKGHTSQIKENRNSCYGSKQINYVYIGAYFNVIHILISISVS